MEDIGYREGLKFSKIELSRGLTKSDLNNGEVGRHPREFQQTHVWRDYRQLLQFIKNVFTHLDIDSLVLKKHP